MPRALSLPSLSGIWRVGQSAKTPPFHGGMTGSTPVRATRRQPKWLPFLVKYKYIWLAAGSGTNCIALTLIGLVVRCPPDKYHSDRPARLKEPFGRARPIKSFGER